jgi:hypothetical protein
VPAVEAGILTKDSMADVATYRDDGEQGAGLVTPSFPADAAC